MIRTNLRLDRDAPEGSASGACSHTHMLNIKIPKKPRWRDFLIHLAIWAVLLSIPSLILSDPLNEKFQGALIHYSDQILLTVGGHNGFIDAQPQARRIYILFPSVFRDPKFVDIWQTSDGEPVIYEQRGTFIATVLIGIALVGFYFWKRWTTEEAED